MTSLQEIDDDEANYTSFSDDDDDEIYEVKEEEENKMNELLSSIGMKSEEATTNQREGRRGEVRTDLNYSSLTRVNANSEFSTQHLDDEGTKAMDMKRQVRLVKNSKKLQTPLSRPVAERAERKVEYKKLKDNFSKWEPVVQDMRKSDHLSFPLNRQPLSVNTVDEKFGKKQEDADVGTGGKMTMEQHIRSILKNSKHQKQKDSDLSKAEEEAISTLSLEEARQRLIEMQRHRVLMANQASKFKRTSKIKSKKFHRHLKKRREKEREKEEEQEAGDIVKEALKVRAEERASLRHGNTGKWARNRAMIAKHDVATREMMNEQLAKHKELTAKPVLESSDDEPEHASSDDEDTEPLPSNMVAEEVVIADGGENPWLTAADESEEEEEKIYIYDQDEEPTMPREQVEQELRQWLNSSTDPVEHARQQEMKKAEAEAKFGAALKTLDEQIAHDKREKAKEDDNKTVVTIVRETEEAGLMEGEDNGETAVTETVVSNDQADEVIDLREDAAPQSLGANVETKDNEEEKDLDNVAMTIAEAFADDDVVAQFSSGANAGPKQPQAEDLGMPGWGRWDGCGIKNTKRRKRRLVDVKKMIGHSSLGKVPRKLQPGEVIINQSRDVHIARHQVNKVPFPFNSTEQFERTISQPVGDTWNTRTVFKDAVKPKVTTVPGAIIRPMHPGAAEAHETNIARKKKQQFNKSKKEKHYKNVNSLANVKLN